MANLLNTIRSNTLAAGTQQQGVTDETSKLQALLRAKQGKAISTPSTASNIAEQAAVQQANTQMQQQIAPAAQIQAQGQQQQQLEQEQANQILQAETAQARKFDNVQTRIATDRTLQELEQGRGRIDNARYKASLDQVAQNLRLQNKKYVDDLQREGQIARLDNDIAFKEELQNTMYGDSRELLEKKLGNQSILDASDRDFKKATARMSVDDAYEVFKSDAKAQKNRAMWEGIAGIGSAGIGAAGTYSDKQEAKKGAK